MNRDVCEHFNPADLPCDKCKSANVQKSTLREAAQQALEALEDMLGWQSLAPQMIQESAKGRAYALRAALAEPSVDDPHRDHWVAIAEAAQKIAASKECGLMEAKALCAALDRLTEAMLAESEERNFCPRCGKRTNGIHTCTPPQEDHFCDTHCTWADHAPGCVRAEPVAWSHINGTSDTKWHPPQRKPLTEDEILKAVGWDIAEMYMKLTPNFPVSEARKETLKNARAIERAHGIT